MQDAQDLNLNDKFSYVVGRVVFVFCLLLSLIGMHSAFAVSHSWQLRFDLVGAWIFTGIAGAGVWASAMRKQIDRNFAASILLILGIALQLAYEALGMLSQPR